MMTVLPRKNVCFRHWVKSMDVISGVQVSLCLVLFRKSTDDDGAGGVMDDVVTDAA